MVQHFLLRFFPLLTLFGIKLESQLVKLFCIALSFCFFSENCDNLKSSNYKTKLVY